MLLLSVRIAENSRRRVRVCTANRQQELDYVRVRPTFNGADEKFVPHPLLDSVTAVLDNRADRIKISALRGVEKIFLFLGGAHDCPSFEFLAGMLERLASMQNLSFAFHGHALKAVSRFLGECMGMTTWSSKNLTVLSSHMLLLHRPRDQTKTKLEVRLLRVEDSP